jgi:hypothetical protein
MLQRLQRQADTPAALSRALDALGPAASELPLARAIILRNANQHRRTRYFRAFRRLCAIASRAIARAAAGGASANALAHSLRAAAHAALPLARDASTPHRGAGFASLAATIAASSAALWASLDAAARALEKPIL